MMQRAGRGMSRAISPRLRAQARVRTLTRVARVLSGELEKVGTPVKKVILCPQGRAATDGRVVWIPETMSEDPRQNLMMQEAILAHEAAGHLRYTDFSAWKRVGDKIKAGEEDRLLHDFVNILEDARVNHLLAQDFAGSGKRLDATQEIFMVKHREMWATQTIDESNAGRASIIAMMTEAISREAHFFPHSPLVCDYMDEVRTHMVNAISQPTTDSVIKSAKKVLAVFREHFPATAGDDDMTGIPQGDDGEGMMMDDMSPEQIDRMAQEQKNRNAQVEEAPRQRFKELKEKAEQMAQESKKAQEDAQNAQDGEESAGEGEDTTEGEEAAGEGENGQNSDDAGEDGAGAGGDTFVEDEDGDIEGDIEGESGEGGSMDSDMDMDSTDGDCDSDNGSPSDSDNADAQEGEADNGTPQNSDEGGEHGEETPYDDDLGVELQDLLEAEELEALKSEAQEQGELDAVSSEGIEGSYNAGDRNSTVRVIGASEMMAEIHDSYGESQIATYDLAYDAVKAQNRAQITTMSNQMKRLLKDPQGKWERATKKGRIDSRRLSYSQTSNRVFRKRNEESDAEVNALILIDASGSMSGHRAQMASESAVVLTEVMDSIGWNVEVVDFHSSFSDTTIRVRKPMHSPINQFSKSAIAMPFSGSSNGDGYAVEWCLNRLMQFKGKKVLFVISDGQPSGAHPEDMNEHDHLLKVVAEAPKEVGLFSIGIDGMDTSVYYPHSASCDARDLAKAVLPVFKQMVRTMR